jgi:ribosomal-protein-alanine N-acetyltransferase
VEDLPQISLQPERLIISTLLIDDAEMLNNYLIRNTSFFKAYAPLRLNETYTVEWQQKKISEYLESRQKEQEIRFFLFESNNPTEIIGDIGYSNIIKGAFWSCYLGYRMDEQKTRKGFMFEALSKANQFMFNVMKLHRIEANIMPHNTASIALVEKLRFEFEGYSKNYLKINGKWEGHNRYALLNTSIENE